MQEPRQALFYLFGFGFGSGEPEQLSSAYADRRVMPTVA